MIGNGRIVARGATSDLLRSAGTMLRARDRERVWDLTVTNVLTVILANIPGLLVGFMLGVLIRSSAGALVAYFVYSLPLTSPTPLPRMQDDRAHGPVKLALW